MQKSRSKGYTREMKRPILPKASCLPLTLAAWLLGCATAAGQPALLPGSETRYQLSDKIEVDRADSGVERALEQARSQAAAGQWNEAIDAYTRVLEGSGNKLLAVTDRRFVSARDYVQMQIAALPPEGRAAYRQRVDPLARKWYLEGVEARDRRRLRQVVEHALMSSWGDNALLALGEIALESGDYASARAYWERIVPYEPPPGQPRSWLAVPDTDLDLAAVRARLVLTSILEGSTARAKDELAALTKLHPTARGRIGGTEKNYVEALSALLAESGTWPPVPRDPDWPTFAGSPQRNRAAEPADDVGQVAWRVKLPRAPTPDAAMFGPVPPRRVADDRAAPLSYHPIVVGNVVLVAAQTEILAFDLQTGKPTWQHDSPTIYRDELDPASLAALNPPSALDLPRFTLTARNGLLLARMGTAAGGRREEAAVGLRLSSVVGLDLRSEGSAQFRPIVAEAGWTFEGTPVSDGSCFYVAMRRHEIQAQLYVGCFDCETGRQRWRQFVCGADTPAGSRFAENANNLLTLDRDAVYYNTNAGAVAALATADGRPLWTTLYPRVTTGDVLRPPLHRGRDLVPCLYDRGTLYVAPADSRRVLAIDAATGQILWETDRDLDDAVHLLGVCDDTLIAAGDRLYWIEVAGADRRKVKYTWPDAPSSEARLGHGRGVLAGNTLWWPTRERLILFDGRTGAVKKDLDLTRHNVRGGNLVLVPGRLLIAGGEELTAFQTPPKEQR